MSMQEMNPSDQLDQLSAMLNDAISTGKTVSPEKLELVKVRALVGIANALSLIAAQGLPKS
jgi:hypothetical protein